MSLDWNRIDPLIDNSIKEDLNVHGDLTTIYTIPSFSTGEAKFISKESGVIAGLAVTKRVFQRIDHSIHVQFNVEDGHCLHKGDTFGSVEGNLRNILTAERIVLNLLQRLSGIATLTSEFVQAVHGTRAKILDTRKTTPQLRYLEKYAVRVGGGENHRFGLYDMILIKDNHIACAGGISIAIQRCLEEIEKHKQKIQIEVEASTFDEVIEAMKFPIHRIMLDNMDTHLIKKIMAFTSDKIPLEASGNITLKNIREIEAVGHRIVHGGEEFQSSILITKEVLKQIENCVELAPLHKHQFLHQPSSCS